MNEQFRLNDETIALGRQRIAEIRVQLRNATGDAARDDGPSAGHSDGAVDEDLVDRADDRSVMIRDPAERVALMRRIHELELENRRLRIQLHEHTGYDATNAEAQHRASTQHLATIRNRQPLVRSSTHRRSESTDNTVYPCPGSSAVPLSVHATERYERPRPIRGAVLIGFGALPLALI